MKRTILLILALTAPFGLACAGDHSSEIEHRSDEVEDKLHQHIGQIFEEHDSDHSGSLSKAEAEDSHWIAAHFDAADANGDDQVTQEEAIQYAQDLHEANCEGEQDAGGDCHGTDAIAQHVEKGFAMLDVDQDGQLTLAESEGQPLAQMFDEADTDDSGTVSLEELHAIAIKKHAEASEAAEGAHGHH